MQEYQKKILDTIYQLAVDTPYVYRAKICAAIVRRRKIISFGFNQSKTHTLQARYSKHYLACHVHAEIDAIKNALRKISLEDLSYCDIYIARAKRTGACSPFVKGLAKPCIGCQRAIRAFGIHGVFYTEEDIENES